MLWFDQCIVHSLVSSIASRALSPRDQKLGARKRFLAFCTLYIWMLYGKAYVGATKNFCALPTFTEIFAPLSYSIMLKNEEIRQKYPFFRKELNYFEAVWITWGCICTDSKEKWKDYCDFVDIWYQKLISHSVIKSLSLYPSLQRMLQLYPALDSYFMSIDKPTVVLKRFLDIIWANSVHIKIFAIICGCFYWGSSEYWEVK